MSSSFSLCYFIQTYNSSQEVRVLMTYCHLAYTQGNNNKIVIVIFFRQ